jgi:hypothetical protein
MKSENVVIAFGRNVSRFKKKWCCREVKEAYDFEKMNTGV